MRELLQCIVVDCHDIRWVVFSLVAVLSAVLVVPAEQLLPAAVSCVPPVRMLATHPVLGTRVLLHLCM